MDDAQKKVRASRVYIGVLISSRVTFALTWLNRIVRTSEAVNGGADDDRRSDERVRIDHTLNVGSTSFANRASFRASDLPR